MHFNSTVLLLVALTGLFRLAEIAYGEWNAKAMLRNGGIEYATWQRWPIFICYALWLALLVLFTFKFLQPKPIFLTLYVLCELLRWWAILHLGKLWTTRVIVIPNGARVTTGPYRFLPHPIYIALFGEVIALSLTFGQVHLATFFGGLTALWIFFRLRAENEALTQLK